jgi:hypothetical protein
MPHGAIQAVPLAQPAAAHWPLATGMQAEPAGKPNAWQSVSRLQAALAMYPNQLPQKTLSAVVRKQ